MKVAECINEYFIHKGISHVFGVSGANIEDLYYSINNRGSPTIVLAKNEYNAASMAMGYYLSTKTISVVMTTSGPGILNTIPILAESFTTKIPLVVITGTIPVALEGQGAFQDTSGKGETFDLLEMVKHCSCFQIKHRNFAKVWFISHFLLKGSLTLPRSIRYH